MTGQHSTGTENQLTKLTTLGVNAVKTYRRAGSKIEVEGYGRAKNFTATEIEVDKQGEWLKALQSEQHSFVVMGEPKDWEPGQRKRRLSSERDGDAPTLVDVPRQWMPIDIDEIDFDPISEVDDGEGLSVEIADRLGLRGVRCVWHLTNSHGFFGKTRLRLWVRLKAAATCAQMKQFAKARWGDEKVEVKGKQKDLIDLSVYKPAQPIYTGDPILKGVDDPVTSRVGFVAGDPLDLKASNRIAKADDEADEKDEKDENIAALRKAGLYIRRQRPGQHAIRCPWESRHSGEERVDDTFYFESNYNGHDRPAFVCHHASCVSRTLTALQHEIGLASGWVYVGRLKRFRDPRDGELVDIATYAAYQKQRDDKQVVPRFLKGGGVAVDGAEFRPGEAETFEEREVLMLNTYVDRRIEPDRDVNASPWTDHLKWLLPDERERDLLCDWMAWAYQHPGKKINWAPVLYGPAGNGKTSVLAALGQCVGEIYEHAPTSDDLKDKFNSWCHQKLLVRIEELMSGDGRYEIAERLKPVITNRHVAVRLMRRDLIRVRNFANVCASTNHINSIPVADGDRRYAIFDTSLNEAEIPERRPGLVELHRWLYERGGLRAVAALLANRDVSGFQYSSQAPETEIKAAMRDASATRLDRAVEAARDLQHVDVVTGSMLTAYLDLQGADYPREHLGHVVGRLRWLPLKGVVGGRGRLRVGERKETCWSPTRNAAALRAFVKLDREERSRIDEKFRNNPRMIRASGLRPVRS